MKLTWKRTAYKDTGEIQWSAQGFVISKLRTSYELYMTGCDQWPLKFTTLKQAKMAAEEWTPEMLRDAQRQAFTEYHLYWAIITATPKPEQSRIEAAMESLDLRLWNDALEEDARRTQKRFAA